MESNAKPIFNDDGTITIKITPNMQFTFTTVSAAVNFCKEYNINTCPFN